MTILYTRPARYVYGMAFCFALAGCAGVEVRTEYTTVPIPIPVPCSAPIPAEPAYPKVLPTDPIYDAATKRQAEIEMRKAYIIELKAAVTGCAAKH